MIFVHDTRDKPGKHDNVDTYLLEHGHQIVRSKLYCGDITLLNNQSVCIDLKRNLQEVYNNLCHDHARLAAEMTRAQDAGIELIFLIEHGGSIKTLEDVKNWNNPRLKVSPYAWDGMRMYKTMLTVQSKYGVRFEFCTKAQTGKRIIELLSGGFNHG